MCYIFLYAYLGHYLAVFVSYGLIFQLKIRFCLATDIEYLNTTHQSIVSLLGDYFENRARQQRHPVIDFLFEYYTFRPKKLLTYNPGIFTKMSPDWSPTDHRYKQDFHGNWSLDPNDFPENRIKLTNWILVLQNSIANKPAAYGCFGLHEWAMVYKSTNVRHQNEKLRLQPRQIAEFVDSMPVKCSHFDAFRFFTPDARPLNTLQPTFESRTEMEQGGCIHANMDLYKWAYKLYPWTSSELIGATFLLALEAREFDMQASPYDLSKYGIDAIKIESIEGRQKYVEKQRTIAEKATKLRSKLINELKAILDWSSVNQKL